MCAEGWTRTGTGVIPHAPQACRCSSVKYVYEGKQPTNYSKLWHIMEFLLAPKWRPLYKTKKKAPVKWGFSPRQNCGEGGIRTHEPAINQLLP